MMQRSNTAPAGPSSPLQRTTGRRRALGVLAGLGAAGCTPRLIPAGPFLAPAAIHEEALVMSDGARLPMRVWQPAAATLGEAPPPVRAVAVALHGFNDSRNFMELPAPTLTTRGVAVYAYDQRGFGGAPNRGIWAGAPTMAADVVEACALIGARHPGTPVFLMGESMGGAIAMLAVTSPRPPRLAGTVLLAPAVWGRQTMNWLMRGILDFAAHTIPLVAFTGSAGGITPTDNEDALRRLWRDPLTIRQTRVDAAWGLVNLMDSAVTVAPRLGRRAPDGQAAAPLLYLYGAKDELVPPEATTAVLRALPPPGPDVAPHTVGYYAEGHHMLLRDKDAGLVLTDLGGWMTDPAAPLPSGADRAAAAWLATAT